MSTSLHFSFFLLFFFHTSGVVKTSKAPHSSDELTTFNPFHSMPSKMGLSRPLSLSPAFSPYISLLALLLVRCTSFKADLKNIHRLEVESFFSSIILIFPVNKPD